MALINNTQGLFVTLPINTKYDPENPIVEDFPTHYDQNGYGGFMAIDSSISQVNGATSLTGKYELIIPEKRRKLGMLIYDVNPSISSFYQCTDVAACSWEEVNFRFRYFYGPTAPAVSNIQVGEKWFDTIVGSEYTYLPIAEGSSEKAWVDIDHIGEGETFSGYMTVDLANTYYVNIGGDEMTGSLTAHKVFRGSKDINFDEDEFVTKSFVFANFPESSGGVFTAHITGTSARFSGGVTAAKFNATQAITEDTQLATKKYVDDNTIRGVDFHIDGQPNPFSTDADAISISGGSNIDIFWDNNSTPNRYVISSTLEVADQFVNIDGDTMTGTLTGTDASLDSITASNGFVGTLTGNTSFMNNSMTISNSLSYENQPVVKIQKIGGTTEENAGRFPGTTGFMNLPRLVLEHNSSNSWGWPGAIDFMTKPVPSSEITSIGYRIGTLFANGGDSNLYFWGSPARNTTYGAGTTGISAGLSGDGLTALGYFQYAVGAADSGFHALKAFRTSEENNFESNEFVTKNYIESKEFRMSGDLPHAHIFISATKGSDDINDYTARENANVWNDNFGSIAFGVQNQEEEYSESDSPLTEWSKYVDLTEEVVGFPKPWSILVKRHFYSKSENRVRYYPPHSTRASAQYGSDPPYNVTYVNNFNTSNDVRVRWIGYKDSDDAKTWFEGGGIGVDTEDSKTRIKMATYTRGGFDLVYGDTYITEIIIVPG